MLLGLGAVGVALSLSSPSSSSSSSPLFPLSNGSCVNVSVVDGKARWDWTRCKDVGKWPVWKVDLCSRREPASDFGSMTRQ